MKARSPKPRAKSKGKAKGGYAKPKRIRKLRAKPGKRPVVESASDPASSSQLVLEENRIDRLFQAISNLRKGVGASPRTIKLLSSGSAKMAQKVIEEAAEVGIEAVRGDREAFVNENADLFYNVVALWTEVGVAPQEIWTEMDRREALLGLAEKLPKVE
jgi:phosphoribosyl-ATP pyrophosphohydrolase